MLKPLHDHVVLEVIKQEKTTKSGIVLPEKDQDTPTIGKVVAIGEGRFESGKTIPIKVKKDDKVIFKKYASTDVKLDGKEYLIIKESDILAILE
ncbi:MAG: co-chaperone GroES [Candidatus Izimaplasma sp.]|nr:co-chaperone GroES [Candidatus Izimaplasma bacterium]